MPNREEYCIYGKKGKLYSFPTRQKAIDKYYKLLDSFWVNNPGTMENPDINLFSYSEKLDNLKNNKTVQERLFTLLSIFYTKNKDYNSLQKIRKIFLNTND